jgi:ribosomal protein S18 acetylase RimI-like enzyme
MPEDLVLRDLRPDEYADFRDHLREAYAEEMITLGGRDPDFARAKSAADTDQMLPAAGQPQDQVIQVAEMGGDGSEDERRIGHLWVGPAPTGDPMAWVCDIEVVAERRGQGFGRRLMAEAERIATELGYDRVGLNVVGGNTRAIGLYSALGYSVVSQVMVKSLTGPPTDR